MADLSASDVFNKLSDIGKTYVQAKYAPGSLSAPPATQASDGSLHPADAAAPVTASNSWSDALAPVFKAFGAAQTNRELNAHPPYWLYAGFALAVLIPLYLITHRK
jgi:hypothetical protein